MKSTLSIIFLALVIALLSACDSDKKPPPPAETADLEIAPVSGEVDVSLIASCSRCHGKDGVTSRPDTPFIAGQSAAYLEIAMRGYLSSERKHEVMQQSVADLDADERMELANYFANLDTKWKGGSEARFNNKRDSKSFRVSQKSVRAGQAISKPCSGCHGDDGNSIKTGVPSLAGLQPVYFIPALKSYLSGARQGAAIMKNFKLSLTQEDINNLAAFFSVQQRLRSPLSEKLQKTVPSDALVPRCVGCHGADGNSTHPAMPSLAGQNATYLVKAMKTYRDARRSNGMMVAVAKGLSDDAIEKNAAYFATRTPTNLQQASSQSGKSYKFDPMGDGARLAASCNACHGIGGNNPTSGAARLAGLDDVYLRQAISEYRDGRRKHAEMKILTEYLSDIEIEKISYYYAAQVPEKGKSKLKNSNSKEGLRVSGPCGSCHGKDGNSKKPTTPSLAGQSAEYLVAAMNAYKENGGRNHDIMKNAVVELDNKSIRNLAQYYSELDPEVETPRTLEGPDVLSKKCNRCHGHSGGEPDPGKPRIAGQRQSYLVSALSAYKAGDRANSMMQRMTKEMWLVEIEAIASYYANK